MKKYLSKYFHSVHPFLFAVFPVLYLYSNNLEEVVFRDIFLSAAMVLVFAAILYLFFLFVFRNPRKAAIVASLFVVSFFIYSFVMFIRDEYGLRFRYLFGILMAVFIASIFTVWKTKRDMRIVTNTFNVISIFLILVSLVSIISTKAKISLKTLSEIQEPYQATNNGKPVNLPDIYYILPDAHASTWELKTYFNYDNSEFTNRLTELGFYVAPKSRTNYHRTDLVLASLLNLDYLQSIANNDISLEGLNRYELIQDHKVGRFLKSMGYTYIHAGTTWNLTHKIRSADRNINEGYIPEFPMILYGSITETFKLLGFEFELIDVRRQQWKTILAQFEEVEKIPSMKEPTFTFLHLDAPHHPFVFNQDGSYHEGEPPYINRAKYADYKGDYLNQLIFVDNKLIELVETLIKQSDIPSIIVIQSDHGSSLYAETKFESDKHLRGRLKNFSAFYLPTFPKDELFNKNIMPYESITPVNTFRLIFDRYFGAQYGFLPDRSFTDRNNIVTDVTDMVQKDY